MTKKIMKVNFSPTLYNQIAELLVIESKLLQDRNIKLHGWEEDYTFDPTGAFKKEYSIMKKLSKNINDSITKYYPYLSNMKITSIRYTNKNFKNKIGNEFNCSYHWYIPNKLLKTLKHKNIFRIKDNESKNFISISLNTFNVTEIIFIRSLLKECFKNLTDLSNEYSVKICKNSNKIIIHYNKKSHNIILKELNKINKNNRESKAKQIELFEKQLNLIYNKNEDIIKYNVYRLILELYYCE